MDGKEKAPCVGARCANVEIIKVLLRVMKQGMPHETIEKELSKCGMSKEECRTALNALYSGKREAVSAVLANLDLRVRDEKEHKALNEIPCIASKIKEGVESRTSAETGIRRMGIVKLRENTPIWY